MFPVETLVAFSLNFNFGCFPSSFVCFRVQFLVFIFSRLHHALFVCQTRNKREVSLWAKHLDSSCIASLLRLQRSKKSWCLVHGFCKKVLKVFHFFFFSHAKDIFQFFHFFFFFCQSDTNLMSWVEHKINDLSNSLMLRNIFFLYHHFIYNMWAKKLFWDLWSSWKEFLSRAQPF